MSDPLRFGSHHLLPALTIALGVSIWAVNALLSVTILPSAVIEIGGVDLLSWATTIYITASIVLSASGGWVKARLGGRGGLAFGAAVFAAGACVCAAAPGMPVLLSGRLLQGIGVGIVAPVSYALVRSAFPEALWPRVFALIAGVWGIAALAGPALGGVLTGTVGWRAAFLFMAGPALLLMALAAWAMPHERPDGESQPLPMTRLATLAAAILLVGLSGDLPGLGTTLVTLAAGIGLLAATILADGSARRPILPSGALSLRHVVGLGLAVKVTLIFATVPVTVYGAYVLQRLHGTTPLTAGYIIALEALGWTAAAFAVARLPAHRSAAAIVAGPVLVCGGLAGTSLTLSTGPVWAVAATIAVMGTGFGVCWAFLSGRVLRAARSGEGDRAAAAIPTVEAIGIALGAATTGVAANALGIEMATTAGDLAEVARRLLAAFVPMALVALSAAIALARIERRGP